MEGPHPRPPLCSGHPLSQNLGEGAEGFTLSSLFFGRMDCAKPAKIQEFSRRFPVLLFFWYLFYNAPVPLELNKTEQKNQLTLIPMRVIVQVMSF
jgi:hypothetical protein